MIGLLIFGAAVAGMGYFVARPWAQHLQASVERDLQAGAIELQQGTYAVQQANHDHNPALLDQAIAHFTRSKSLFQRASARIQGEWVVRDSGQVPWLGSRYLKPRLDVVAHVAAMGMALNDAGTRTAGVDRQLLVPANPNLHGGERLIGVLNSIAPELTQIQADLKRAGASAALVDPAYLPAAQRPTFAKVREQIQSGLAGIVELQRLSPVLLEILGANGARSYLMEQVDPAELRGGGGFIGSFSILAADHGALKLGRSGDVGSIDAPYPVRGEKKYVPPPNSTLQFGNHGWVFGDSNFSADFPTSARVGQELFLNQTGIKVDGVISIDPDAVAALLHVTGPIAVPEYNTTVQGSTFAEDVFQREEKLVNIVPGKKNFFPAVADRLIQKISTLPSDSWSNLLSALNGAVQGRHLQVYFNNQPAETEMERINWAGATVTPTSGREVMLEVESNFGGGKTNHFIERSYELALVSLNGKLNHHLVITLKNSTPNGYSGGRQYTCYLRYYYPASATDAVTQHVSADQYPSDEKLNGLKLADGWLKIPITNLQRGFATYQVVIDYTTDIGDLAGGHEIYWQKQAGIQSDKLHVTFQSAGKTYSADSDLGQDRLLVLTPQGLQVRAADMATARLPILTP